MGWVARWAGWPLLSHTAKNNNQLLPFSEKPCVPGPVLSINWSVSGRTLRIRYWIAPNLQIRSWVT